jgi:serine/threonine protein kinase
MLMECVQGGELYSRIHANQGHRGGALDPNAVAFYAANVVVALRHLHSKDIVYRDLKVRCLEGWGDPL